MNGDLHAIQEAIEEIAQELDALSSWAYRTYETTARGDIISEAKGSLHRAIEIIDDIICN